MVTGRVSAVGEGVDSSWSGRRVLAGTGETGGFTERAAALTEDLIPVPDELDLTDAVALHTDGSTALGLVEKARILPGDWLPVEAAGGGAGSLLVQLAHAAGAKVIGAARGIQKLDAVRDLGAASVVDYSRPDWTEQVREATGGTGPDVGSTGSAVKSAGSRSR
ncbi:zinc-binding dehydrogenase [Nonomuraea sp. NPDC049400]|uniref:zinc-binding dehydrogenase n=1 Tax=Nonomuraea sp. NPDC049400 TaxID=3364352 RepID=UPI0037B9D4C5